MFDQQRELEIKLTQEMNEKKIIQEIWLA